MVLARERRNCPQCIGTADGLRTCHRVARLVQHAAGAKQVNARLKISWLSSAAISSRWSPQVWRRPACEIFCGTICQAKDVGLDPQFATRSR